MVKVRRKENESVGSLLRRFTRAVQASGFLVRLKKRRYHASSQSDYQKKKEALRRIRWEKDIKRLRKLGKVA